MSIDGISITISVIFTRKASRYFSTTHPILKERRYFGEPESGFSFILSAAHCRAFIYTTIKIDQFLSEVALSVSNIIISFILSPKKSFNQY